MDPLKMEIKKLLLSISGIPYQPEEIKDDTPLFGDGLNLDSIDVLELVVHLDKKYDLKVRNNEEGHKTLSSVNSIAQAIQSIREGSKNSDDSLAH